jgi:putative MFS transporter
MVGEIMDSLPITRYHKKIMGFIGAGIFLDAFDVYMAGAILATLVSTKFATLQQVSLFVSVTFLGFFIGAILSGYLGDKLGRRLVYQLNLLIFGVTALIAFFATNMETLIVLRGIMGIGLGAELVVGYATLHEFVPPKVRGKWLGIMSSISASTALISAIVAYVVIPSIGWRWMFLIVAIPTLIVWVMRMGLPESPRWLESRGRLVEAMNVVEKFNAGMTQLEQFKIEDLNNIAPRLEKKYILSNLFKGKIGVNLLVATIVNVMMTVTLYTVTQWIPTLLVNNGFTLTKSLGFVAIINIGSIIGALLATYLSDKIGRRWTIGIFALTGAVFSLCYASVSGLVPLFIFGFATLLSIYVLVAMIYGIYVPELFPTNLRLTGTGISNSIGRLANVFVPLLVPLLVSLYGPFGVFGCASLAMLIMVLCVTLHKNENKGKSLEVITSELQDNEPIKGEAVIRI